jgi:YD repeat-containing protein
MERGLARARAAVLAARYDDLVAAANAAVVRWRWATPTSGYGDVEPLRLERMGRSPGEWLEAPTPGGEHEAIGFDELGRVVCVRTFDATGEAWLERFARWSSTGVEVACFRPPLDCGDPPLAAALQAVTVVLHEDGVPVESERFLPPTGAAWHARYRHEDGRLARVEEADGVVDEVLYDEDGQLEGIDRLGPDGRHPLWRPARTGSGEPLPA